MNPFLFLLALLWSGTTCGAELHLLELDRFALDYGQIENYQDSYFVFGQPDDPSQEHWKNSVAATFNLNLLRYNNCSVYWNNDITTLTTNRQYRMVRWQFEGGVNLSDTVKVWARHLSAHLLDQGSDQHFPLQNEIGITAVFYQRGRK